MTKMMMGLVFALVGCAGADRVPVSAPEPVIYQGQGQKFAGFILRGKENSPAVLMVHNWMGVSDETQRQAERFHALGYTVMAADIYGQGVRPTDVKGASALATKYKTDRKLYRERLNLALTTLKNQPGVDKNRIAAVGYCFGGTGVVELARSGADLDAVVSFHGGLDSPRPQDGKKIKAEVLALHGADDPYVPANDVTAFENEMKRSKVKYDLVKYPGAVHSFTEKAAGNDPKKGAAYNADADKKSFAKATSFLKEVLK